MNSRKLANARMLAVVILLSLMFQNVAKAWDFDWISQFGTTESDIAGGVAADSTGVYVAGSTIGVFPGQSAVGGIDVFLRKYSLTGSILWTRQLTSPRWPLVDASKVLPSPFQRNVNHELAIDQIHVTKQTPCVMIKANLPIFG